MYAAQEGHTKAVEVLLQYEASVDLKLNVSVWPRVAALLPTVNCSRFGLVFLFHLVLYKDETDV